MMKFMACLTKFPVLECSKDEYYNDATPMADMINLDAVKIEYRKVTGM